MSLKFAMAQTLARKIVENPSEFPELVDIANGMLQPVYIQNWCRRQEGWDRDDQRGNFWPQIKKRLPEIIERFCTENG